MAVAELTAETAPLGLAQDWWFEHGLHDPVYAELDTGIVRTYKIVGDLDEEALRLAVQTVVGRHGALRTRFVRRDRICQLIEPPGDAQIRELDLRNELESSRYALAGAFLGRECTRPFDLEAGPQYRVFLVRVAANEWVFALHVHAVVFDGWSTSIFFHELTTAYAAALERTDPELPRIVEDYAAFAAWEQTHAERNLDYWRGRLSDVHPPELFAPPEGSAPPRQFVEASLFSWWTPELADAIRSTARRHRAGVATLVVAGYASYLAARTGVRDLAIVTLLACRPRPHLEHVIGRFANVLPIRVEVEADATASSLIAQARRSLFDAVKHQHASGAEVARLAKGAPALAFFNYPHVTLGLAGTEVEPFPVDRDEARVDLPEGASPPFEIDLMFRDKGSRMGIEVAYDAARLARAELSAFMGELQESLVRFCATASE